MALRTKRAKPRTSERGRLVKNHWEIKPAEEYRDALGKTNRGRGIYVLYRGTQVYYVGLSRSTLRSRIRAHATRDRHKGVWDSFSFYQITKTRYIKDIESLILSIFRPEGNRVGGRFNKKHNMARQKNFRSLKNAEKLRTK